MAVLVERIDRYLKREGRRFAFKYGTEKHRAVLHVRKYLAFQHLKSSKSKHVTLAISALLDPSSPSSYQ